MGDLTFIKSNAPWLGLITGQFVAPFAVDHTQCQIPHTRDGILNGQIPHYNLLYVPDGGGGGCLHLPLIDALSTHGSKLRLSMDPGGNLKTNVNHGQFGLSNF